MKIIHFDIDENLKPYLKGENYSFSLNKKNISKIKDKNKIEGVTFKSQSDLFDKKIIEEFPNLKLVITRTAGTDHVNLDFCKEKNIAVYNIPDYGSYNIAEHAFALLLNGAKNITSANNYTHQGKFDYANYLGVSLKGKTLGVLGTGKIGLELIKMAKGFDMDIFAFDVFKNEKAAKELNFKYVPLDELLKNSDFISVHVPLFPKTKHMIGENEIKKIKKGAILVNTSRGAIIDTKALIRNINKFKAVCLDVLENEKTFSKNHPLLSFSNVIITPHIAFYSDATVKKIAEETLENIKRFQKKDNTNRVI